jgi:hypothetical protein
MDLVWIHPGFGLSFWCFAIGGNFGNAILARSLWPGQGRFLFLYAMAGQAALLILRPEHPCESLLIAAFHLLATISSRL